MNTAFNESASLDGACAVGLIKAVQKYFDLMYDCDTSRFDQVFRSTVQLHGYREGKWLRGPLNYTERSSKSVNRRNH